MLLVVEIERKKKHFCGVFGDGRGTEGVVLENKGSECIQGIF